MRAGSIFPQPSRALVLLMDRSYFLGVGTCPRITGRCGAVQIFQFPRNFTVKIAPRPDAMQVFLAQIGDQAP